MTNFIIGVPSEDDADLRELADVLTVTPEFATHRPIDGQLYVELIVRVAVASGITAAGWTTFRTWLKSRADLRKASRVTVDGIDFWVRKPADIERVLKIVRDHRAEEGSEQ